MLTIPIYLNDIKCSTIIFIFNFRFSLKILFSYSLYFKLPFSGKNNNLDKTNFTKLYFPKSAFVKEEIIFDYVIIILYYILLWYNIIIYII